MAANLLPRADIHLPVASLAVRTQHLNCSSGQNLLQEPWQSVFNGSRMREHLGIRFWLSSL